MSICMIQWSRISSTCRRETSSILFLGAVVSMTKILEGKAKYPLKSNTSKDIEEQGRYSGVRLGGPEACERGISKIFRNKTKIHAHGQWESG